MVMKITPRGKPLPTVWRHVIKIEHFRAFSFRERIQILFGYNLVTAIGIATEHSPGNQQPYIVMATSRESKASELMKQQAHEILIAQNPKVETVKQ